MQSDAILDSNTEYMNDNGIPMGFDSLRPRPEIGFTYVQLGDQTPLTFATAYCRESVAIWLIEKGASIYASDYSGYLPIQIACYTGATKVIERCLKMDPQLIRVRCPSGTMSGGKSLLSMSVGTPDIMKLLIHYGADVNEYSYGQGMGSYQKLSCPVLSSNLDLESAKILFEAGANFSKRDAEGQTALHNAAINNRMDLYEFLVDIGCRTDARDHSGKTAIECLE